MGKRDVAESFAAAAPAGQSSAAPREDSIRTDAQVIRGRATYEGKTYYLLYDGTTSRGRGVKLAFRDGSRVFWARNPDAVKTIASYQEARSIDGLRIYAERQKAREHGHVTHGGGRCKGCGGEVKDAPHHRAMDGYCGGCAFDEFDC